MKPLILTFFLLSLAGAQEVPQRLQALSHKSAQNVGAKTRAEVKPDESLYLTDSASIAFIQPAQVYSIRFGNTGDKYFQFTYSGDSLVSSGTLKPDSAATLFIKYVVENYSKRMDELKAEIRTLEKRIQWLKRQK